nr:hypothetical protein [Tanacetum cinerariifolium]
VLGFGDYIEDFYAAYEQHKLETVAGNECFLEVGANNEITKHVSVIDLQNLVTELCERLGRLLQYHMEEDVKPIFPY